MNDKQYKDSITSLYNYDFELPAELIAQHPADKRDGSRLMVVDRATRTIVDDQFKALGRYLPTKSLLVANNSRVLPARLKGRRPSGGLVEFLLLTPLPLIQEHRDAQGRKQAEVTGLLKSSKRLGPGQQVLFDTGLKLYVEERFDFGRCRVRLVWEGQLMGHFTGCGEMPLPPYIQRDSQEQGDEERYQTTYARPDKTGSVAAPTAGLHFTEALRSQLASEGHDWAELTLYVGYGTFSPVRVEDIREHRMHGEYLEVSDTCAAQINKAKDENRPVIAVGTTTVRSLEGVFADRGRISAYSGWTDIYIQPGHKFQVVDGMLTNFHLPKSSLIILVSAFAGTELIRTAYTRAIEERFRFFSYGDSMLIV